MSLDGGHGHMGTAGMLDAIVVPQAQASTASCVAETRAARGWGVVVLLWLGGVSAYLFALTASRFDALALGVHDLAFFAQAAWNSLHGSFMAISFWPYSKHLWGGHLNLTHVLLLPVYAAWPSPVSLLAMQALSVGLTGWGLFLLGRLWLSRAWMAAAVVLLYTLHPGVHGAASGFLYYGYHADVWIPPLFIFAVYFAARGRTRALLLCWLLGLGVLEQYGLLWAGLGLFLAVRPDTRRLGIGVAGASLAWMAVATLVIVPYCAGGARPYYYTSGFHGLGLLWQKVAAGDWAIFDWALMYLRAMAGPFGFLPLTDAFSLLSLPAYLFSASAGSVGYAVPMQPGSWHNSGVLPVMAVALLRTLGGLSWFGSRLRRLVPEGWCVALAAVAALLPLALTPPDRLPGRYGVLPRDFASLSPARRLALEEIRQKIPEDAVLAADFFTGSQFLNRRELRLLREDWRDAEYVLADRQHAFGGLWPDERQNLEAASRRPGTLTLVDREGFVLLRLRPSRGAGSAE